MFKKITFISLLLLLQINIAFSQSANQDFMRSMGKMYVVVAVIVATFLGIIIYLIRLDKKLTKLENQFKKDE